MRRNIWYVTGKDLEWVLLQMLAHEATRLKTDTADADRRPALAQAIGRIVDGSDDLGVQAFHVDVQLVLAACIRRIDRQTHGVARHSMSRHIGQMAARLPRKSEIMGAPGSKSSGLSIPAMVRVGMEREVRAALAVRERCVSESAMPGGRKNHFRTRGWIVPGDPIDHTVLLDYLLQGAPISRMGGELCKRSRAKHRCCPV